MSNLNFVSSDDLENLLWKMGLNSHNLTNDERKKYVDFLCKNRIKMQAKTILNAVSYVMHTYFHSMDNEEKEKYICLLLSIDINTLPNFGDIFDILGILYKKCPENLKQNVIMYIVNNSLKALDNPSAVISVCNCFSYIFDELSVSDQKVILKTLRQLMRKNSYSYLDETLFFTENLFVEGLKQCK